jgi:hypothetical protein
MSLQILVNKKGESPDANFLLSTVLSGEYIFSKMRVIQVMGTKTSSAKSSFIKN